MDGQRTREGDLESVVAGGRTTGVGGRRKTGEVGSELARPAFGATVVVERSAQGGPHDDVNIWWSWR